MDFVYGAIIALAVGLFIGRCVNFIFDTWFTIPLKHGKNWITYTVLSVTTAIALTLVVLAFMALLAL